MSDNPVANGGTSNPPVLPMASTMTLRDYFAGQALAAFIAIAADGKLDLEGKPAPGIAIASQAYAAADFMLSARTGGA